MPRWLMLVVRVAPLVIGAIQGAEVKFPGPKRGAEKLTDVVDTVMPVAADSAPAVDHLELRKAVMWTVDAAVQWMKVFGVL